MRYFISKALDSLEWKMAGHFQVVTHKADGEKPHTSLTVLGGLSDYWK
jgi:hypothetical protein